MKRSFVLALILFSMMNMHIEGQAYSQPESIIYDRANQRYLVSNRANNTIVSRSENGTLTNFIATGLNEPHGLLIKGDTLISVNKTYVMGYLLSNATEVFNLPMPDATFLNDCALDENNNLYVSDWKKYVIFKINLSSFDVTTLVSSGIKPNGLLYDYKHKRLLQCDVAAPGAINAIDLETGAVTNLYKGIINYLDGMATDEYGNIYFSSWGDMAIYAFDYTYGTAPIKVASGFSGPADISFDTVTHIMAVPNYNKNEIILKPMGTLPMGIHPVMRESVADSKVSFTWTAAAGATEYKFEIANNIEFANKTQLQLTTTTAIIEGLDEGIYYWRVRATNGTVFPVFGEVYSFVQVHPTEAQKNLSDAPFTVYPNPAISSIFISGNVTLATLADMSGKVVRHCMCGNTNEISVEGLPAGTYLLVTSIDGEHRTGKVIIE